MTGSDAEIGVWTSTDPAEQQHNAYLYGSCNPIMNIDADGNLSFLSHYIIGGWNDAQGDFWRADLNPMIKWGWVKNETKSNLAMEIHRLTSTKAVDDFFSNPENRKNYSGLTDQEWNGFRQHAYDDANHEYPNKDQRYYTPLENLIYLADGGKGPSKALADYQDMNLGQWWVSALVFSGVAGPDYTVSMIAHLGESAVYDLQHQAFFPLVGKAAANEAVTTAKEATILSMIPISPIPVGPITFTILTTISIVDHVRHWFLQD